VHCCGCDAAPHLGHGDHAHPQYRRADPGVGPADDRLRNMRTTLANWLARAFVAPYFVNFHLQHHLSHYVPCNNLPALHRILHEERAALVWKSTVEIALGKSHRGREIAPGYAAVLHQATSRPEPRGPTR